MCKIIILVCSILLLSSAVAYGKMTISEGISIDSEMRFRYEFDDRDFFGVTGFDGYGTLRTLLGFEFENIVENTSLTFRIIDSRMFGFNNPYLTGKPTGPNGFDNNLGVNEAYIGIKNIFTNGTKFMVGRMPNYHGRHIILGPGN